MQVSTLSQLTLLNTLIVHHCEVCGIPLVDLSSNSTTVSWWQTGKSSESETKAYAQVQGNGYYELKVSGQEVRTTDIEVCRAFLASIRKSVPTVKADDASPESDSDDPVAPMLRRQFPINFVRYWDKNGFFVKVMNNHPVLGFVKLSYTSRVRNNHTYVSQQDFSRFCKEFYIVMGVELNSSNFKDHRSTRSSRIRSYKRVGV